MKTKLPINPVIIGTEHRPCSFPGCEWWDGEKKGGNRYGTYVKGRYYCPEHGKLFDGEGKLLSTPHHEKDLTGITE